VGHIDETGVVCMHVCVNDGSEDFFREQHGRMVAAKRACLLGEDLVVNVQKYFDEKDQVVAVERCPRKKMRRMVGSRSEEARDFRFLVGVQIGVLARVQHAALGCEHAEIF
jgi:hypothetical protein